MSADAVPVIVTNPVSPLESLINTPIAAVQSVRQVFTFRWANAAARTAQTGMREGDMGFQIDTDTTYQYIPSSWNVWATPMTAYAPTIGGLTLGNGSITGKYQVIGGVLNMWLLVILGTTSSVTGSLTTSLPLALAGSSTYFGGSVLFRDVVNGVFYPGALRTSNTTTLVLSPLNASGTWTTALVTSGAIPFGWAATDTIQAYITGAIA